MYAGRRGRRSDSAQLQNAITPVPAPIAVELAGAAGRRPLFYARPEPHAARNLFELGVIALERAARGSASRGGWELDGIGTVPGRARIALGGARALELLPRPTRRLCGRLREHDVGLALMYTPHSEPGAARDGLGRVAHRDQRFENKTAGEMEPIFSDLICAEPTIGSVAAALRGALGAVADVERRVHGSAVAWSRDCAARSTTSCSTG